MAKAGGLLFLLSLLAVGCGPKEEVRRYKAPKDDPWRMMAAIASGKDATWFFKVVAPADHLGAHREEILNFFRTIHVADDQVKWTKLPGWEEDPGHGDRQACLHFGAREPKLEMTVNRLVGDAGGTLANVNRWLGQLGRASAAESDLPSLLTKVDGAGTDVAYVDLVGPKRPVAMPPRMKEPPRPPPSGDDKLDRVRSMFAFDLPHGWKENPNPHQNRVFEFTSATGAVQTSLSILGGEGGGVPANVNRWRNQVGLDPLGEEAAQASARPFRFLGIDGWNVEIPGRDRTIACIFTLSREFSIFLKMEGPPGAVSSERAAFEELAQSFKMGRRSE